MAKVVQKHMNAMRVSRTKLTVAIALGSVLCACSALGFLAGRGNNGFDTFPLVWLLVLMLVPVLSVGCMVWSFRNREGSKWWVVLGIGMTVPQVLLWFAATRGVLHYLFGWFS